MPGETAILTKVVPPIHRKTVNRIVEHLSGLPDVPGVGMEPGTTQLDEDPSLLACHEDPFDAACGILGIPYDRRMDVHRLAEAFLTRVESEADDEVEEAIRLEKAAYSAKDI